MDGNGLKIGKVLKEAKARLRDIPEGELAAEVLFADVLGISRDRLFMDESKEVAEGEAGKFLGKVERHIRGEPVAYLTGVKEFYGMPFMVDKRVLIPRPETEHLVDEVLNLAGETAAGCGIIDVGTGSGCIAVTLAKRLPGAAITASDVSADALEVAKANAERLGTDGRIRFVHADLLDGVAGNFDIVVANLPYIGTEKYHFVSREAAEHEPSVALYGGADGLVLYERLFMQVGKMEQKPRYLLGEFGFLQGEDIRKLLDRSFPDAEYEIKTDYASIERLFVVKFPPI
jgi:release factor glutamine methyltransferase